MSKDNEIIDAEFSVEVVNPDNLPSTEVKEDGQMSQVDAEFEYARANIINIIEKSDKVLDITAELVIDSEHPSMIEVYTKLIKNLTMVNLSLSDLRERKMKIKGEEPATSAKASTTNVTNNTIFVGSTEELIKSMKG